MATWTPGKPLEMVKGFDQKGKLVAYRRAPLTMDQITWHERPTPAGGVCIIGGHDEDGIHYELRDAGPTSEAETIKRRVYEALVLEASRRLDARTPRMTMSVGAPVGFASRTVESPTQVRNADVIEEIDSMLAAGQVNGVACGYQNAKEIFRHASAPPGTPKQVGRGERRRPMLQEEAARIVEQARERICIADEKD